MAVPVASAEQDNMAYANHISGHQSRQTTMPVPDHSMFTGRMLFLTPNQQCQSTEGMHT